jgi:hypothetical protein
MEKIVWLDRLLTAAGFTAFVSLVSGAHGYQTDFDFDFWRRPSPLVLPLCTPQRDWLSPISKREPCVTLTKSETNKNWEYENESKIKGGSK